MMKAGSHAAGSYTLSICSISNRHRGYILSLDKVTKICLVIQIVLDHLHLQPAYKVHMLWCMYWNILYSGRMLQYYKILHLFQCLCTQDLAVHVPQKRMWQCGVERQPDLEMLLKVKFNPCDTSIWYHELQMMSLQADLAQSVFWNPYQWLFMICTVVVSDNHQHQYHQLLTNFLNLMAKVLLPCSSWTHIVWVGSFVTFALLCLRKLSFQWIYIKISITNVYFFASTYLF